MTRSGANIGELLSWTFREYKLMVVGAGILGEDRLRTSCSGLIRDGVGRFMNIG